MEMDDRIGYILLGALIGFVLGYIVRSLREIKTGVDKVENAVKHQTADERGAMSYRTVQSLALVSVVALTAWAAFSSQSAVNSVKDTQSNINRVTMCSQQFLSRTIGALNERTEYTQSQILANVALQNAQSAFLSDQLVSPPPTEAQSRASLQRYFVAVNQFIKVNGEARKDLAQTPYPTNQALLSCVETGTLDSSRGAN